MQKFGEYTYIDVIHGRTVRIMLRKPKLRGNPLPHKWLVQLLGDNDWFIFVQFACEEFFGDTDGTAPEVMALVKSLLPPPPTKPN